MKLKLSIHTETKGFTLVELAIVITIIGILIGGVLKGQQLIDQARLAATINQVNNYRTALSIFKTTYNELPGDMLDPDARIVGCSNCKATNNNSVLGNHQIGPADNVSYGYPEKDREPTLYWLHLLKADMLSGITDAALTNEPVGWGTTHPAAKIGGGFTGLSGDGGCSSGPARAIWSSGCTPQATVLLVLRETIGTSGPNLHYKNSSVLTPLQAATIDRKMDDGKAMTGDVIGAGTDAFCNNGGPNGDNYSESSTSDKKCSLGFIIDK